MTTIITARSKAILIKVLEIGILLSILGFAGTTYSRRRAESLVQYTLEQDATCPSLLSIARSARDTLIVMKNKEMCTKYMLDHLK